MDEPVESEEPTAENDQQPSEATTEVRRLLRSSTDRVFSGVAAGVADYLGVDSSIVRVGFVVLTLFGGVGLVLYASGWLLMPEQDHPAAYTAMLTGSRRHQALRLVGAVVLGVVAVGLLAKGPFWSIGGWHAGEQVGWTVVVVALVLVVLRNAPVARAGTFLRHILRRFIQIFAGLLALAVIGTLIAELLSGVPLEGGIGDRQWHPTSIGQLAPNYRVAIGAANLDLSQVVFPDRTITVTASVGIGKLIVEVPPNVRVSFEAHSGIGNVEYPDGNETLFNSNIVESKRHRNRLLVLNAQTGIGSVELVRS